MEIKDQIKRNVSITDVVQSYGIDLKPAGKHYKALCPFHTEKTPSFFVKPESDTYACYGCNNFGDIFAFVQNMENIGFVEAMNFLIEKFNIPVEKKDGFSFSKEKKYTAINEAAVNYFTGNLGAAGEGENASQYLRSRGITEGTIKDFSLGYAMNKWDGLLGFFKSRSIDLKMASELGLLIINNKGEFYDRFRGRIIFPIFSESGAVIAFGGRTIGDDSAKYLNSPDTPIFRKGKNLYGFNITKPFMREKRSSILVEGYFDVISLYQNGIRNVAASLGTALTPDQIHLLRRVSDEIIIGYDSDEAGIEAAVRGIERMFEMNINPHILSFHEEKDPDEFIRKHGKVEFDKAAVSAPDSFRFMIKRLTEKFDIDIPEKKRDAVREMALLLNKFDDPIIRKGYISIAADYFEVEESEFMIREDSYRKKEDKVSPLEIYTSEKIFLQAILKDPSFINIIEPLFSKKLYTVLNIGNLSKKIFSNFTSHGTLNYNLLQTELSLPEKITLRTVFDSLDEFKAEHEELEKMIESSMVSFFRILNDIEIAEVGKKIKRAEREGNMEEIKKLLQIKSRFNQHKYKVLLGGDIVKQQNGN